MIALINGRAPVPAVDTTAWLRELHFDRFEKRAHFIIDLYFPHPSQRPSPRQG